MVVVLGCAKLGKHRACLVPELSHGKDCSCRALGDLGKATAASPGPKKKSSGAPEACGVGITIHLYSTEGISLPTPLFFALSSVIVKIVGFLNMAGMMKVLLATVAGPPVNQECQKEISL